MIPWALIIVGALCTLIGLLGLLSILLLPFFERLEIVYDKDKEILAARMDEETGRHVWQEKRYLTRDFVICCVVGVMMFFTGFYLGFAEKGEGFWLYRKLFPDRITAVQAWDEINENGQYVSAAGKTYTYYVLISGNEVSLSGTQCADLPELKEKLSEIRRENTVIIIDSFAVSSTYHAVEDMLNELGIEYEETK